MEARDVFLLEGIIDLCDRIASTIVRNNGDLQRFTEDLDFQEVCAFRVIQVGELVNSLSQNLKDAYPDIPWHAIIGFRNILTHDYGKIDVERMWNTVNDDIPELRDFCAKQIGKE
ncbi:DUF86 domain-containing protein [Candidatus Saccharibacteria bacterium]|nr:DUF86 domain-containing protein [Candidatus Saccharibacteria bacterium]